MIKYFFRINFQSNLCDGVIIDPNWQRQKNAIYLRLTTLFRIILRRNSLKSKSEEKRIYFVIEINI